MFYLADIRLYLFYMNINSNLNFPEKLNILVAEDNEISKLLVTSILQHWGFESKVANNGQEAIDFLLESDFPLKDGIEATVEIRNLSDERKKNIPIIALTANTTTGEEQKCLNAGMNGFLHKPFKEKDLQELIGITMKKVNQFNMPDSGNTTTAHYDISFIRELTNNDEAVIKTVIETFLRSVPPLIESLMAACAATNWLQAAKDAHSLKSNIDALQIHSIHEDVKNIDAFGKQNINIEQIPAMAQKVKQVLTITIAELKQDFNL